MNGEQANLGLATTKELMEELEARLQFHSNTGARDMCNRLRANIDHGLTETQLNYRRVDS